jgi:ureidoacrylate peracid hydrolase
MFRDYRCIVLEDCTAEPMGDSNTRSNHEASLMTIERVLGWVSSSNEFIAALKSIELARFDAPIVRLQRG